CPVVSCAVVSATTRKRSHGPFVLLSPYIGGSRHVPPPSTGAQMTTTIPQQADELRIVRTPPTVADAQLIVQMQMAGAVSGANRGYGVIRGFDTPPTLGQLRKK